MRYSLPTEELFAYDCNKCLILANQLAVEERAFGMRKVEKDIQ